MRELKVNRLSITSSIVVVSTYLGCASTTRGLDVRLTDEDREQRRRAVSLVESDIGFSPDPALNRYLARLGKRVDPGGDIEFYVLDAAEPNAFALPSGAVFVSRGLLALANSEDELVGVLGHEVAHVATGHGEDQALLGLPFSIVSGVARAVLGLTQTDAGQLVASATSTTARMLLLAPVSRSHEYEADRMGVELSQKAGYDATALADLLLRMSRFLPPRKESWLDGHPPTLDRVAEIRELSPARRTATLDAVAADFLAVLDGMELGPGGQNGALIGTTYVHLRFATAFDLPERWALQSQGHVVAGLGDGCAFTLAGIPRPGSPEEILRLAEWRHRIERTDRRFPDWNVTAVSGRHSEDGLSNEFVIFGDEKRSRILTVAWRDADTERCSAVADDIFASVRSPAPEDLQGSSVTRLRIMNLQAGRTLRWLVRERGSPWTAGRVAALNGIDPDARFEQAVRVKVPVQESYAALGSEKR